MNSFGKIKNIKILISHPNLFESFSKLFAICEGLYGMFCIFCKKIVQKFDVIERSYTNLSASDAFYTQDQSWDYEVSKNRSSS